MEELSPTAVDVLDAAEHFARTEGYNGFSFRDIADEIGIKSASVHYHFPTKADLGAAVARRYADRFLESLGNPDDTRHSPSDLLARYVAAFRQSLGDDKQMCLCGMLGAEVDTLPTEVVTEIRVFFAENIDWLKSVLARFFEEDPMTPESVERHAVTILATLEGALLIARTLDRIELFDKIADAIVNQ